MNRTTSIILHRLVVHALSFVLLIFPAVTVGESLSAEATTTAAASKEVDAWPPATSRSASVQDLHGEYRNVFRYGNRNAASHKWSTFLLDRAHQMESMERLELFFSGFCAVSGSPVRPSDYNRYMLTLPKVGGKDKYSTGYMHYCCWPCVCDTQDFIKVDTLTVTTKDGTTQQKHFAVIGNPCDHPEKLDVPFYQPFGRGRTTLRQSAPEVRCLEDGTMEGATMSDHGYIIISMFFDAIDTDTMITDGSGTVVAAGINGGGGMSLLDAVNNPQPGRISKAISGNNGSVVLFQDEREYATRCKQRADNGYNSGMGEIFREVCAISPIQIPSGNDVEIGQIASG